MTDNFLYALQRNVVTPSNMSAVLTSNGGSVTLNPSGSAGTLAVLGTGLLANSNAYLYMRRPILLSGGYVRCVCTARISGSTPGRFMGVGFGNGYPLAGTDVLGVDIVDGDLAIIYAVNGFVPPTFVTRLASFSKALPVFDPALIHTYDLRLWPTGRVELRVDGVLVHTLVESGLRAFYKSWLAPNVSASSTQVSSITGSVEVYALEFYSEREPAARLQTSTQTLAASTSPQVIAQLLDPSVEASVARIERIRVKAGTGDVNYVIGLASVEPVGTATTPAGEKVGAITAGLTYAQDLGNLGDGTVLPTEGAKVVWERKGDEDALLHRSPVTSLPDDPCSLYVSLVSASNGGNVALSVDYSVH